MMAGSRNGDSFHNGDSFMRDRSPVMSDDHFDLISVLYHALEGAITYEIYLQDAEADGDEELSEFFREIQIQEGQKAERARELLTRRLVQMASR